MRPFILFRRFLDHFLRPVVTMRVVLPLSAATIMLVVWGAWHARAAESVLSPAFRVEVSLHWDAVPLRSGLERLAAAQQVTIFLDRRVDPGERMTLVADGAPLCDLVDRIAEKSRSGVTFLGQLAYVGPIQTVRMIRTLAALQQDRVTERAPGERARWAGEDELRWGRLTSPRSLIGRSCDQRGIEITGLERIPHDLWPAGALPSMAFSDQMTVLLAGFDLTFSGAPHGGPIELVPVSGKERIVRRYETLRRNGRTSIEALARRAPDAEFSVDGHTVVVRGRVEDHDLIAAAFARRPSSERRRERPQQARETVFSLRVQNQPVGPVLQQLAKRLDLSISFDEAAIDAAGVELDRLVSFEVEKGTVDDVLKAALLPAKLTFDRRGKEVRVYPAGSE